MVLMNADDAMMQTGMLFSGSLEFIVVPTTALLGMIEMIIPFVVPQANIQLSSEHHLPLQTFMSLCIFHSILQHLLLP